MRVLLLTICFTVCFTTSIGLAQQTPVPATVGTQAIPYPQGISMPFRIIGPDAAQVSKARQALDQVGRDLAPVWLNQPQDLTTYIGNRRPLTLNYKRVSGQIVTGPPKRPSLKPVTMEPVWCSMMDRYLLFVNFADTERHTLLGSAHATIPKQTWDAAVKTNGLTGLLRTTMTRVLQQAATKVVNTQEEPKSALHIGLNVGRGLSRQDETQSQCLNMLVAEQLAPDFVVTRAIGGNLVGSVRFGLKQPANLRRPTRVLNMKWSLPEGKVEQRTLPVQINLQATHAESVMGQPIDPIHRSQWTLGVNGDQVTLPINQELLAYFRGEEAGLQLADAPQIAKIDRAWVYLDRGRAWGLKMRDRLIVKGLPGEPVKGHVVRFFGPEAGITSPRGFPIREGAIVYIRKGQAQTRIGQELGFDGRQYPTPWPPKKGM